MLSTKFIAVVVVGLFLAIALGIFPGINTFFRGIDTTGLDTEMLGIAKLFPYIFFGVIFYAAYWVWKRNK